MKPIQKVLMTILWGLTVLIMVSVIGAGLWRKRQNGPLTQAEQQVLAENVSQPAPVQLNVPAPQFDLIDQDSKPVTKESLAGKPWIAEFVFTHCAGPCPRMTGQLAALQKELPANVQFVSFSVDPERDTPAVLKEYAKKFEADESRWRFLTGAKDAIFAVAKGMMLTASPHSTRFVLIDAEGMIRQTYESDDEKRMADLKHDAAELASEKH
jgi:cytochrome oxidase Cu insertion factor (SCO1/SenC/PrrC family)